ncbi:MAG TPA: hypothetical protein VF598_08135, partial [Hymenobacter sp.]
GRAPALAHGPVAVELGLPRLPALPVVELQRRAHVVGHHAVAAVAGELGYGREALLLKELGHDVVGVAPVQLQGAPLVQGLVAVPHPARDPAPVVLSVTLYA